MFNQLDAKFFMDALILRVQNYLIEIFAKTCRHALLLFINIFISHINFMLLKIMYI